MRVICDCIIISNGLKNDTFNWGMVVIVQFLKSLITDSNIFLCSLLTMRMNKLKSTFFVGLE